ncbi:HAD family hydrolase [Streptomyces sp. MS2.AVA.5]|uniref:HAD family hydrolase n=1 Tax=Streptomyces achmelvichensis TaxID=3134111 RepID=A0ACC6PWZ7_9ACTN
MTDSHSTAVPGLFAAAKCVVFDFDGPVCDLFAGHAASDVARDLRHWIARNIPSGVSQPQAVDDPLAWLRAAAVEYPGSELVTSMERHLTSLEVTATLSAAQTAGVDELIRRLGAASFRLAIATNNSARAAQGYLVRTGLADFFGDHIHGRATDPLRMKPDPHCVSRALESTGSTPAESLMIGDSASDCEAAAELGVPFLGYARNKRKRCELIAAGASDAGIVSSIVELLPLVDGLGAGFPVE